MRFSDVCMRVCWSAVWVAGLRPKRRGCIDMVAYASVWCASLCVVSAHNTGSALCTSVCIWMCWLAMSVWSECAAPVHSRICMLCLSCVEVCLYAQQEVYSMQRTSGARELRVLTPRVCCLCRLWWAWHVHVCVCVCVCVYVCVRVLVREVVRVWLTNVRLCAWRACMYLETCQGILVTVCRLPNCIMQRTGMHEGSGMMLCSLAQYARMTCVHRCTYRECCVTWVGRARGRRC